MKKQKLYHSSIFSLLALGVIVFSACAIQSSSDVGQSDVLVKVGSDAITLSGDDGERTTSSLTLFDENGDELMSLEGDTDEVGYKAETCLRCAYCYKNTCYDCQPIICPN